MGCCGGGKTSGSSAGIRRSQPVEASRLPEARPAEVQYRGGRPVTVIGPVTGRQYRFQPGGVALVDARDRQALAGQPGFRVR